MVNAINIYHSDCLESMAAMPDKSVDMVLVDPPYGITANKWDSVIPLEDMWLQLKRITKARSVIVFMGMQPFTSVLIMSCAKWFRQALVWCKNKPTGYLNANRRHLTSHEDILIFSQAATRFSPQKIKSNKPSHRTNKRGAVTSCYGHNYSTVYCSTTERYPTTLIKFPVVNNDGSNGIKFHPNQKPVVLMEYLIKTYSHKGDTVLDFAMGSGTTGVACLNTGRNFIGIEKYGNYFNAAQTRLNAAIGEVE